MGVCGEDSQPCMWQSSLRKARRSQNSLSWKGPTQQKPGSQSFFLGKQSLWLSLQPHLTLPLIPDTLKSPFLCTLSMAKAPEASQPLLFPYFLLSLANCCGIQSDVSHLNPDIAREGSLLLILHEGKRPNLGNIQGQRF